MLGSSELQNYALNTYFVDAVGMIRKKRITLESSNIFKSNRPFTIIAKNSRAKKIKLFGKQQQNRVEKLTGRDLSIMMGHGQKL